jgi:hypothetical protein
LLQIWCLRGNQSLSLLSGLAMGSRWCRSTTLTWHPILAASIGWWLKQRAPSLWCDGKESEPGSSLAPPDPGCRMDHVPLSQAQESAPKELPARDAATTVSWSFGPELTAILDMGSLDRWLWGQFNRDGRDLRRKER